MSFVFVSNECKCIMDEAWQSGDRFLYLLVVVLVRILNLQLWQLIAILIVARDEKLSHMMEEAKNILPLLLLQLLKVPASLLLLLIDRLKAGKQSLQQAQNSLEHIHLNSRDIASWLLS